MSTAKASSKKKAEAPSSIETDHGNVSFKSPTFVLDRVKYESADVMAAALNEENTEEAQQARAEAHTIIAKLVQKGSGILVVDKGEEAPASEDVVEKKLSGKKKASAAPANPEKGGAE